MTTPPPPAPSDDTEALLGAPPRPGRFRGRGPWLAAAALALAGLSLVLLGNGRDAGAPRYLTEPAQRGNLTVTVSASGTLQPINQVDVGSEQSGTIEAVLVDDNDRIRKGQVLARLDSRKLTDQVAKSRAALESAQAVVLQALATEREAAASLARLREVERLSGGKVPSRTELDSAEAALARNRANIAVARAAVAQARATLATDETNLAKAYIRSPIDGVVLTRKVEPGQTVAATMTAPVLFTLAEDLTQMELQVKVDEADVGQVREGQEAKFTVDAYPNRTYPARITRVGLGSSTTDNVVSYLTVLQVNNPDLSLRPGMTATAIVFTQQRDNVLLVPNAALRFTPAGDTAPVHKSSLVSSLMFRPPRGQPKRVTSAAPTQGETRTLWVLRNGQAEMLQVTTGATNGRQTEIQGDALKAGDEVITDYAEAGK
jgi:HlyD family secretion protein